MARAISIDLTAAPPDDPVRAALEDDVVRAKLLAQARAITRLTAAECVDLVQMAIGRAWEKRAEYDANAGSFTAWVSGFIRNIVREQARKRTPGTAADGLVESVATPNQPDELERAETRATVHRWLASLPEPFRTAVEWRFLLDREYDALAEHLSTTSANARQLVSRGINKLKAIAAKEDRS